MTFGDVVELIVSGGDGVIELYIDPLVDILIDSNAIPTNFSWKYEAIEGFDKPNGKFANTMGNVALIDCHYLLDNFKIMLD